MALELEQIQPWDGQSGTGAEVRGALNRNFEKLKDISLLAGTPIKDSFTSVDLLPRPGIPGNNYLVGENLYVWSESVLDYVDIGSVKGQDGLDGIDGKDSKQVTTVAYDGTRPVLRLLTDGSGVSYPVPTFSKSDGSTTTIITEAATYTNAEALSSKVDKGGSDKTLKQVEDEIVQLAGDVNDVRVDKSYYDVTVLEYLKIFIWGSKKVMLRSYINWTSVEIFVDGIKIDTITTGKTIVSISGYLSNDVLHILIGKNNYISGETIRERGIMYYTFNLANNTKSALLQTIYSGAIQWGVGRMVELNGKIYAPAYYMAGSGSTTLTAVDMKATLLELTSGFWSEKSIIATSEEVWGVRWTDIKGFTRQTLNSMNPYLTNLSIIDNQIYACISSRKTNNVGFDYLLFEKKTSDNLIWEQVGIETEMKSRDAVITKYNGKLYIIGIRELSNDTYFSEIVFCEKNSRIFSLVDGTQKLYHSLDVQETGTDVKIIAAATSFDSVRKRCSFTTDFDRLLRGINQRKLNYKGELDLNDTLPTLNVGDYFKLTEVGTYLQLERFKYVDLSSVSKKYITVDAYQTVNAIWNGSHFIPEVIMDNKDSIRNSIVFAYNFSRNEFISIAARIPVVCKLTDGTLAAFFDVRYVSPSDFGSHEIGMMKSYDGGKTWKDSQIVLKRYPIEDHYTVMNPGVVVDNNKSSSQYGRVWLFANSNVPKKDYSEYTSSDWILGKLWMIFSDDFGETWSVPQDITYMFVNKRVVIPGVSAGITLNDGTLIMPIYYSQIVDDGTHGTFLYKAPSGYWTLGDITPLWIDPNETPLSISEPCIIQDKNGHLIMNSRVSGGIYRAVFSLTSIGTGWVQENVLSTNLSDVISGCHSPFVRYRNTYLRSQPIPRTPASNIRENISVFYSYDNINWDFMCTVMNEQSGGYSSLICDDETFGILYEKANGEIGYADLNYLRNLLR